jgi:hypothetical protein
MGRFQYGAYPFRLNCLDICKERWARTRPSQQRRPLLHGLILVVRTVPPKINIYKVIKPVL